MRGRFLFIFLLVALCMSAFNNCVQPKAGAIHTEALASQVPNNQESCNILPINLRDPQSIDQTVDLINALPKPLSLDCFIKNLKSPLEVVASDNTISAQPAGGFDSPRIFIIKGPLILSIVPAGPGKDNLEVSQVTSSGRSVKGDLLFPVTAEISEDQPYSRIYDSKAVGTDCRFCHSGETAESTGFRGPAFSSMLLEPMPYSQVQVERIRQFAATCDPNIDSYRCKILKAVVEDGLAIGGSFPK